MEGEGKVAEIRPLPPRGRRRAKRPPSFRHAAIKPANDNRAQLGSQISVKLGLCLNWRCLGAYLALATLAAAAIWAQG
jgi:hypothetical protein